MFHYPIWGENFNQFEHTVCELKAFWVHKCLNAVKQLASHHARFTLTRSDPSDWASVVDVSVKSRWDLITWSHWSYVHSTVCTVELTRSGSNRSPLSGSDISFLRERSFQIVHLFANNAFFFPDINFFFSRRRKSSRRLNLDELFTCSLFR
jgi:hypothetical protein